MEELIGILEKFGASGWDVIDGPAKKWLKHPTAEHAQTLVAAIERADAECGQCGCEYDPLYKRALALKELLF